MCSASMSEMSRERSHCGPQLYLGKNPMVTVRPVYCLTNVFRALAGCMMRVGASTVDGSHTWLRWGQLEPICLQQPASNEQSTMANKALARTGMTAAPV